jgi:hypothetical protein
MRWTVSVALLAASAGVTHLAAPAPARACGGFFCDASQPVNQAAERIIFSRGDDGQITAVIQIQYAGPAERFAWMLPVAGSPTIAVSSNLAFDRLQQATNPRYQLDTRVEGECAPDQMMAEAGGAPPSMDAGTSGPSDRDDAVTVVDQGSVGPYDYVVISVDANASLPASVAVEWLRENGYDIDDRGAERIGPYLESGLNLLSFRLTKGNDAGAIRPVMLGFGAGLASIPIRPTAVAAVEDMGVMVWVLGPHRAYPVNYASLELNEALINWFNPGSTYNAVVTEAANQAGGQGFVTEMSGASRPFAETIIPAFEASSWELWRADPSQLASLGQLRQMVSTFASHDGLADALADHLVLPDGVTVASFVACPWCVELPTDAQGVITGFDAPAFVEDVEADVMRPMRETQALFARDVTATRLYTTMSADEMNVDPSFDFNPDLAAVDALHVATRTIECSPELTRQEAPWRVALADGQVVRGLGQGWPFSLETSEMPANARVVRVGPTGQGAVVVDNAAPIASEVAAHNAEVNRQAASLPGAGGDTISGGGGGCSGGGQAGGWAGLAGSLALAFAAVRRRLS